MPQTGKAFAQRLAHACDARKGVPAFNRGEGRLGYLVRALEQEGAKVTMQSVSRWYNGDLIPRDKNLVPLATILGVTPEWLRFGGNPDNTKTDGPPKVTRNQLRLRPDFLATFELPTDLTDKEAARLARFIRSLPLL